MFWKLKQHKFAASSTKMVATQFIQQRKRIKGIKCSIIVVQFQLSTCLAKISLIRTEANTAFAGELKLQPVKPYTDQMTFPQNPIELHNSIHVGHRLIIAIKIILKNRNLINYRPNDIKEGWNSDASQQWNFSLPSQSQTR